MLEGLFVSKTRIALLNVLLLAPQGRFYLRELAAKAGVPLRSAQIELARLAQSGIVIKEISGRQTYYRVDERCPILPELRSMFTKTVGIADAIKDALQPESDSIRSAMIFGSFARGDVTPESDVDLLVIGDITPRRLVALLKSVRVSRPINPVVMSENEFEERRNSGDHFLTTVLESPLIYVLRNQSSLHRLIC